MLHLFQPEPFSKMFFVVPLKESREGPREKRRMTVGKMKLKINPSRFPVLPAMV